MIFYFMRTAIGAVIIKHKRLLLVKERDVWILPGGKPNEHESHLECLTREVGEELSGTRIRVIGYYGSYLGKTPHTGDLLNAFAYIVAINGRLREPSAEISDARFIRNFKNYKISEITQKIINSLKQDNYL